MGGGKENMNDQTRWGIGEVITENKAREYENKTKKLFNNWLEKCPVKKDIIPETLHNDLDGTITINFHIRERR